MIVYLDSSAMVKLCIDEEYSALVRRLKEGKLQIPGYERAVADSGADCKRMGKATPDPDLAEVAGELAARHTLRGFDAVHLACALNVQEMNGPGVFSSFDKALIKAAKAVGLTLG